MGAVIGDSSASSVEGHPPARGHIPALDGLRGLAIILVLLTHAIALPLEPMDTRLDVWAHALTRAGWMGVDLFFVLSGFLITGILLDTRNDPHRWSRFFARRALRIFPLYYGVLLVVLVVPGLFHWQEPNYLTLRGNQAWYWTYTVNFLEVVTQGHGVTLNTAHFWSLSIEEQFYIFWPFVIWTIRPKTLFRLAAIVGVAGLALRIWIVATNAFDYPDATNVLTPLRLDGLMMGAVLATLARMPGGLDRLRTAAQRGAIAGVSVLGVIGFMRRGFLPVDSVITTIGLPLIALTFGAFLVIALTAPRGSWIQRLSCNRALRSWGKYSYGIYVFHYLIIGALLWRFDSHRLQSAWLGGSRLPSVLLLALLVAALSYAAAWISYQVFEKRFLVLKRYFDREGPQAAGQAWEKDADLRRFSAEGG